MDHSLLDMSDSSKHSFSLIASQAFDDKMTLLRDPLSSLSLLPGHDILIIGGTTLPIARVVREINKHLDPWKKARVSVVSTIENVQTHRLSPSTSVICLQELDNTFFSEPLTKTRPSSLQELLMNSKHVLWVNHGGQNGSDPYSNMIVGLGRALLNEMPELVLQFVDMDVNKSPVPSARTLVEMFLQLIIASQPVAVATESASNSHDKLLWTTEPELIIDNEHRRHIPRIVHNSSLNNVHNASRRRIRRDVSLADSCVELDTCGDDSLRLIEGDLQVDQAIPSDHTRLRVLYTCRLVTADSNSANYLGLGTVLGSDEGGLAMFLCSTNASIVDVADHKLIIIEEARDQIDALDLLQNTANNLLARSIQSSLSNDNLKVVIY